MRRDRILIGIIALVLTVLTMACSGAGTTAEDVFEPLIGGDDAADSGFGGEARPAPAEVAQGESFTEAPADEEAGAGSTVPGTPPAGTSAFGERIIKEGSITVLVEEGEFDRAFQQVVVRAQSLGGDVVASSSSTGPGGLVNGSVTVRVPVANFEDLISDLGDLGQISERSITSQDVTAEFVDLKARRRQLRAQEAFYLQLLDEAQTIQDAIAVQQQLEELQVEIEQITGRLNVLEDRSSFSTLTVFIDEADPETVAAAVEPEREPGRLEMFAQAALDALINVLGALLVAAAILLPFVVIGVAIWLLVRWRRSAREATPQATVPTPPPGPVPPAASQPHAGDQPPVTTPAGPPSDQGREPGAADPH